MNNKTIEVNNLSNFEFWLGMFKLRTKKWRRDNLRILKAAKGLHANDPERGDKIKALQFLLK